MKPSMLIVSCQRPELITPAMISGAGCIVLDLEDTVAIKAKEEARNNLVAILKSEADLSMVDIVVRINPLDTQYGQDDINAIRKLNVSAVILPKASIEQLHKLEKELEGTEIKVIPLVESCLAVEQALFMIQNERVVGLALGGEDLAADLEVERTKEGNEILYARQRIVNAAKALKKECIDTYYTHLEDIEGLLADARFAKSLGFTGKFCTTTKHVTHLNSVFIPTVEEIEYAREVLRLSELSVEEGPHSINGKMIDKHMIIRASKLLDKAKDCGVLSK